MVQFRPFIRSAVLVGFVAGLVPATEASAQQATPQGDTVAVITQQPGMIQRYPDVAHDPVADVYLAVSANQNLRGRFVNGAGVPMGQPFDIDQRGATQLTPRVTWSPHAGAAGAFLVTWLDYQQTNAAQVWGRIIAAGSNGTPAFVTNEFMISDATENVHPEMGAAVAYSTGSQVFMVVYRDQPNFDLRGQRVSNTGAKIGTEIAITSTPYWEGEPSITYNRDRDEFLVAYFAEPVDRAGLALTVPVRASDGVLTRGPVAFGGGSYITLPQVQYDTINKQYLAAYFTYKPQPVFEGRWLLADGTPDPARGLFPLAAGYGSYDGFHLTRNARTESYMATFHGLDENDMAIEVASSGTPTSPFRATFSCPSCAGVNLGKGTGNFNPRLAASGSAPDWFLVSARSFTETIGQRFVGTARNDGGGGGPLPPPPPPPPPSTDPRMALDLPVQGVTTTQPFAVAGWALDRGATVNTGVSQIDVWAFPTSGGAARFLGNPTYGHARPDVAGYFGGGHLTNSGFGSLMGGLPPGGYTLRAFAYSTIAGQFNNVVEKTVTLQGNPHINLDLPGSNLATTPGTPFPVAGWALDLAAASGTGVTTVHVWAFRNPDSATPEPVFLGIATMGGARPDVRNYFGASEQFTNSGFGLTTSLPAPGTYSVVAFGYSSVSGAFVMASSTRVTVF